MTTRAPRKGLLAAAGLLAASMMSSAAAIAAEPGPDTLPISVIAIQTPDADDQAEALTKALRAAVKDLEGWSMAEGDFSLEVLTISLKCVEPPDAACQSRIADQIKSDRYVWGIVKKKGNNVVGDIHLWVRGQGTFDTSVEYSANLTEPNDEALRRIAKETLNKLTGGPPKGTVHVKVGKDVAGQVFIDNQPVGALAGGEGKFPFPAGPHKVVVKAPGYSSVESQIVVKASGMSEVVVSLVPLETEKPTNWKRIGGFVGVGAGVAFGAVGLVGTVKVLSLREKFQPFREEEPYAYQNDICAYAKDSAKTQTSSVGQIQEHCDTGKTFEILQYIMYPLAGLSAGLGAFLIMTSGSTAASDEAPKTGWTVQPKIGLESGKIDVTYRF